MIPDIEKTSNRPPLDLDALTLRSGNHSPNDAGLMCVMEAVAYVAGEPWSDHPACACPVISAFLRRWNDDMDDAGRQMLKPYIPRLVGTKATKKIEGQRAWMATDWMVRTHTPAWLRLAGLEAQAVAVESLPEFTSADVARAQQGTLNIARSEAAAAWAAARAAAWDAARAAARAAAWDAAWAAARDAAWDAAWDAARDAARDALAPTKLSLQASALDLLERMIALGGK